MSRIAEKFAFVKVPRLIGAVRLSPKNIEAQNILATHYYFHVAMQLRHQTLEGIRLERLGWICSPHRDTGPSRGADEPVSCLSV